MVRGERRAAAAKRDTQSTISHLLKEVKEGNNMDEVAAAKAVKAPNGTKTPAYAWVVLAAVFLISLVPPLNMFKAPPLAAELIQDFGLTPGSFGLFMSVFTIMSVVLAFPAAGIAAKFGMKNTTIVGAAFAIIGSLVGSFATTFPIMLVGRFLEGTSLGLIAITAPTIITSWFPLAKRGLALGIWGMWIPFANVVMLNTAPAISINLGGWHAVWWYGTIISVVALVLFIIFAKKPTYDFSQDQVPLKGTDNDPNLKVKNPVLIPSMWIIAALFMIFNITMQGTINSFYPLYLSTIHGLGAQTAGSVSSVITILACIGCPLGGWLSDKLRTRKWTIMAGLVAMLVSMWFLFSWRSEGTMWAFIFLMGLIGPFVTVSLFAATPEIVKKPQYVGLGMAIGGFGQNIGALIGGSALGIVVDSMTTADSVPFDVWSNAAHALMIPVILIGIVVTLFLKVR
jgi:MFS family permease